MVKNDCIAIFMDLSNTFKHSDRYKPNAFADRLGLYPEEAVQRSEPPRQTRNRIISNGPSGEVIYWPVLTTTTGGLIHYRYAAESALSWWHRYHSGQIS